MAPEQEPSARRRALRIPGVIILEKEPARLIRISSCVINGL